MTKNPDTHTRRSVIATTLAAGSGFAVASALSRSASAAAAAQKNSDAANPRKDFEWLAGKWNVRHRRLKTRLADDTRWEEFDGTSELWMTMNGFGTVDDNVIELPDGTYRAVGIRAFNPETGLWSIWWLDERNPTRIEPPVFGKFENGVGLFKGDDVFNGTPIKVRFIWSDITENSARWEQAFSPDGGKSWEVNWIMHFSKA